MDSLDKTNKDRDIKTKPYLKDNQYKLTEKDFYPPEDTRVYHSGVANIKGGDNFAEYANWFYDNYGDEIFDD